MAAVPRDRTTNDAPSLTHSGVDIPRFVTMHILGALFPLTAGLMFYGWRALGVIAVVSASAAGAIYVWRRVGRRGSRLHYGQGLWLAVLLAMTLPPQLLRRADPAGGLYASWPILPAAGVTLVILIWLLGGTSSGRIHPVLVTHLLLYVLFAPALVPGFTLVRDHVFNGDVLDAEPAWMTSAVETNKLAWLQRTAHDHYQAIETEPPAERLQSFTSGREAPERSWISLEGLLRDRMPPLEDLIVGGQPAAIGTGSAIAIIIGGLFLLYRGLIDYRVPLLICIACLVTLLILPVPLVITEHAPQWRWLVLRAPGVGLPIGALGMTFANYEMMASPLLFAAFFLATSPAIRPMTRRARTIYATLVGILTAAFQLYVSVSIGPYLALLAVSLLTPTLDNVFRPRTIV